MGIAQDVAARVRAARVAAGLSRAELAAALGASPRTVTSWEHGVRTPPVEVLVAIAGVLGVPAGSLLGDAQLTAAEAIPQLARAEGTAAVLDAVARFVEKTGGRLHGW